MRYYYNETPKVDDIVMCNVEKIQEYCIYVKLIEYNNIEGMVQLADASTRRKRKSVCLLKVNRKYPLLVIRVDEENKYIDLSNKFLTLEDKDIENKRYNDYSFVIKILKLFLSHKFEGKYSEDTFIEYANKCIWKIHPKKCYEYLVYNYVNDGYFDDFDIDYEDKISFKNILKESFGEIIFKSTINFVARNPNFEGISTLKKIYSIINDKYGSTVMLNTSPNYYLSIESDNSIQNATKIAEIEKTIRNLMTENNCLYKMIDIVKTSNLD